MKVGGSSRPSARRQVEALVAGRTAGMVAVGRVDDHLPPSTRLLSARLVDGVLEVDLSREFGQGGGTALMASRLNQLFYTLTQPADVDAVSLRIEGEVRVFSGGPGSRPAVAAKPA